LKKIPIPHPPITEQREIGKILSNIDILIKTEKKYLQKLENIKQGLMQQLLTGEKRVKV